MLVLSRKTGEQIVVPECDLTVTILEAASGRVRLGISAPPNLTVHRREVSERIHTANALGLEGMVMSIDILIADRDQFLANSYRKYFGQFGANVATAASALSCLDRLRQSVPDVLVLDPTLLWGGGEGVLALLEEEPEIRPASVMLLSQGGDRNLLYRLSHFKVDDYQTKPMNPRRLLECIGILHRSRTFEPSHG